MSLDDDARLSRSGLSGGGGKLDRPLKTLVDEQTEQALVALAFASAVPVSEYIRDVLLVHVHGHAHLLRVATQRGRSSPAIGTEAGR